MPSNYLVGVLHQFVLAGSKRRLQASSASDSSSNPSTSTTVATPIAPTTTSITTTTTPVITTTPILITPTTNPITPTTLTTPTDPTSLDEDLAELPVLQAHLHELDLDQYTDLIQPSNALFNNDEDDPLVSTSGDELTSDDDPIPTRVTEPNSRRAFFFISLRARSFSVC